MIALALAIVCILFAVAFVLSGFADDEDKGPWQS